MMKFRPPCLHIHSSPLSEAVIYGCQKLHVFKYAKMVLYEPELHGQLSLYLPDICAELRALTVLGTWKEERNEYAGKAV